MWQFHPECFQTFIESQNCLLLGGCDLLWNVRRRHRRIPLLVSAEPRQLADRPGTQSGVQLRRGAGFPLLLGAGHPARGSRDVHACGGGGIRRALPELLAAHRALVRAARRAGPRRDLRPHVGRSHVLRQRHRPPRHGRRHPGAGGRSALWIW